MQTKMIFGLRACLKSSNKDSNERKSEHLSRSSELALTVFPKSAEFVEPAEKALCHALGQEIKRRRKAKSWTKVHHGKLAAAWLEKDKEKIGVFFLPPYAPEYNPDEYLNHALKISVHSGQLPYTAEDISHKIQSFMRRLQHHPSAVSSFFFHSSLSYLCPQK